MLLGQISSPKALSAVQNLGKAQAASTTSPESLTFRLAGAWLSRHARGLRRPKIQGCREGTRPQQIKGMAHFTRPILDLEAFLTGALRLRMRHVRPEGSLHVSKQINRS